MKKLFLVGLLILGMIGSAFATTNYKQMGKVYPQGTFKYDGLVKVYDYTVTVEQGAQDYLTIAGLHGNTAKEYVLEARIVNAAGSYFNVRLNNDTGANYIHQYLNAFNTTVIHNQVTNDTFIYTLGYGSLNNIIYGRMSISAKSGYVRSSIAESVSGINGTTIDGIFLIGNYWNNTADELTSLVVFADASGGIGVGSNVILWQKEFRE